MRSLKRRFITTNVLMVTISTALVILVTLLLLCVFSVSEPDGFQRVFLTAEELWEGEGVSGHGLITYAIFWAVICVAIVLLTCMLLSAKMSKDVLTPLKELKQAAQNIADGNLDFEVMACDDAELDELSLAFEEIRKKLKENQIRDRQNKKERDMMMANLSHDLRTPVTSIKGYLEGIKDGIANTPEKMDKYLDTIYSKTIVIQKMVDNMAEYSELELGRMQYVFDFLDFTEFLSGLAKNYEREAEERGIAMTTNITGQTLTIVADRNKLKRVFDNLISNAMKYNRENGTISISMKQEQSGALICITDTGTGIKEKDLNKVFDGFYRGDAARSNIKGNGLGLGISKQIIESHHGKIWIKSEENIGTEVFVYLPVRTA